jgi:hypothetical protein
MTKFLKIIWSINGVALLIFFIFVGFTTLKDFFGSSYQEYNGVLIDGGEELEDAKKERLLLQGLEYSHPISIYGHRGYLLPIKMRTYETPKSAEDQSDVHTVNIVFFDRDMLSSHALLDKKAFIKSFRYPIHLGFAAESDWDRDPHEYRTQDSLLRNIIYLIAFTDSNGDGSLSSEDKSDLYISELDGGDLRQITSGVDVDVYESLSPNEILISYSKREQVPDEHKTKCFAKYLIKERRLEQLQTLAETLKKIEATLTK